MASKIDIAEILRQKAAGERNEAGDHWGDWVCQPAADEIERLRDVVEEQAGRLRALSGECAKAVARGNALARNRS